MSKKSKKSTALSTGNQAQAFSFGEPIPVLDRAEVLNYFESVLMYEKYYNPPINYRLIAVIISLGCYPHLSCLHAYDAVIHSFVTSYQYGDFFVQPVPKWLHLWSERCNLLLEQNY